MTGKLEPITAQPAGISGGVAIRTLIVDDDMGSREALAAALQDDPAFEFVGSCADGKRAIDRILELDVKLILADVQMPLLDAFEMLEHFDESQRPRVIFVTAREDYAVRAFEVGAVDYVLKPFTPDRLRLALARAQRTFRTVPLGQVSAQVEELLQYVRRLDGSATPQETRHGDEARSDHLVVKAEGAIHFVKTTDLIWIEAQGDFVKLQTSDTTQLVRETLQALEAKLDPSKFLRIHRSFVVNLAHVLRVETALYGDYWVFMSDGSKLRLSRTYRAKLKSMLRGRPTSAPSSE